MMSRYYSYISSAAAIIEAYKGEEPFVHFIKKHFAANKKFGSRDRKMIASLCYCYFRTAHLFNGDAVPDRILKGLFLCESEPNALLEALKPEWNGKITWDVETKAAFLSEHVINLFPLSDELSYAIDKKGFAQSFLIQPLLYIRIRPGKINHVLTALEVAGITYRQTGEDCLALSNAISLENLLRINRDVVVQDLNSQKVFDFPALSEMEQRNASTEVWDCCAASGGKSLLLYDRLGGRVKLTVSDIRISILANLKKRLAEAKVPVIKTFVADLEQRVDTGESFDVIICDAPCTGSGTWSRTPEQLAFFKPESIEIYAGKQKKIASNALSHLKKNGLFFYITCSVFKKENEEVVQFLENKFSLRLLGMRPLPGYETQADSMFVAVLQS